MSKKKRTKKDSFLSWFIFFVTVAVPITVSLAVFVYVNRESGGNTTALAITMLIVIVLLTALFAAADTLRRKIMVERPTRRILDATEKIAAGDFSVRLDVTHGYEKYDEYDLIMENLNRLAEELGKSEVLKTDFISNVSHELKTPLSVIRSYASQLQKDGLDDETRKKYAETIVQATNRLNDLVSNILKLNRLENSSLIPEKEKFRLDELLTGCILGFEESIERKQLILTCNLDECEIVSNAGYLEIVFNNLLSNAIKFTKDGGKIEVTLKNRGGKAVVSVADTGLGISQKQGAHIFDKFYQGDTSHAQEGNGLGLALVKKVIDVLGGEISVKSELGKGSTFTVALVGAE